MSDILATIVEKKWVEIEAAKQQRPFDELERQLADAPPLRPFAQSIFDSQSMALIAEVKKASPSAGLIREDFDPVAIAQEYEQHGATCISVLTDESFFQGHLDYLTAVRNAVSLPVLRKDFILDRYQVLEARVAGADCILLIAECLDNCQLRDLYFYAHELEMDVLLEIYDPENLEPALELEPRLLGVNNRNLKTFVTDLEHSIELRPKIPNETALISESGIKTRDDVLRLQAAGVKGILVGETLMRSPVIGDMVDELLGN